MTSDTFAPYRLPRSIGQRPLHPGPLLAFGAVLLLTSAIATQLIAYRLHFHPELGKPLLSLYISWLARVYAPWEAFRWAWMAYWPYRHADYPQIIAALSVVPYVAVPGLLLGGLALVVTGAKIGDQESVTEMHDSARWATAEDLEREGFFRKAGLIIGGFKVKGKIVPLHYDGDKGLEHIAVPGDDKSTQAKTNGLIPLQREESERIKMYGDTVDGRREDFWGEEVSLIFLDVKGSLAASTSMYQSRSLGKDVLVFEPLADSNEGRASWNHLSTIRLATDHEPDDCHEKMLDVVSIDGKELPNYFDNASLSFGAAIIAAAGYRALREGKPELLSWPSIVDYISAFLPTIHVDPATQKKEYCDAIIALCKDLQRDHDPTFSFGWVDDDNKPTAQRWWIVGAALAMEKKEAEEKSGVYGTFIEKLGIFRSGTLRKHICKSTFRFSQIANRARPAVVYLNIPAMQLDQFRQLVRMFFRSAIRELTATTDTINGREVRGNLRSTVIVIDEVATLGSDPVLRVSSGFLRGHGVMLNLLWQTNEQKVHYYGDHEVLTPTMGVHIHGRPEKPEDAKRLSDSLGQFSYVLHKHSKSSARGGGSTSQNTEVMTRPLMSATEVKRLPGKYNIVLSRGLTILAYKWPYWKHPWLVSRAKMGAVKRSDVLMAEPFFMQHIKEIQMADFFERLQARLDTGVQKNDRPTPDGEEDIEYQEDQLEVFRRAEERRARRGSA